MKGKMSGWQHLEKLHLWDVAIRHEKCFKQIELSNVRVNVFVFKANSTIRKLSCQHRSVAAFPYRSCEGSFPIACFVCFGCLPCIKYGDFEFTVTLRLALQILLAESLPSSYKHATLLAEEQEIFSDGNGFCFSLNPWYEQGGQQYHPTP